MQRACKITRGNTYSSLSFLFSGQQVLIPSYVYQARRFKFIPVALAAACTADARIVPAASSEVRLGCAIYWDIGQSLEYRCPRFAGFPVCGTKLRYFLRGSKPSSLSLSLSLGLLGRYGLLPQHEIETLRAGTRNRVPAKSYSATSNLITSIRKDNKHRNNLPNV